jgi:splicing factor 3B subunit 4
MASLANVEHRNQEATCYVGNLDPSTTEDLLVELFTQIGRVNSVHMPKDKLTGMHGGYGFVEFLDVSDAEYCIQIMSMVKLFGRPMRVSKSALDKKSGSGSLDVGANLFIGNLDPGDVDEKLLYDTFSAFGTIIKPPKIMRDDMTNQSRGFGFVSFDSFEASDLAIECMHNQYLCNRQISVQYAFKKASMPGGGGGDGGGNDMVAEGGRGPGGAPERHGSRAERMLAAANPHREFLTTRASGLLGTGGVQRLPNTMFATTASSSSSALSRVGMGVGGIPSPSMMMMNAPPMPPPLPPGMPPPPVPPPPLMHHHGMMMPPLGGGMPMPPPPPPPLVSCIGMDIVIRGWGGGRIFYSRVHI